MTSLLRDEVTLPVAASDSSSVTSRPASDSARATARPITPPPMTTASSRSVSLMRPNAQIAPPARRRNVAWRAHSCRKPAADKRGTGQPEAPGLFHVAGDADAGTDGDLGNPVGQDEFE